MRFRGVRLPFQLLPLAGALVLASSSGFAAAVPPVANKADTGSGQPILLAGPSTVQRARYTVMLKEPPLASYAGGLDGFAAPPRAGAKARADVRSPQARAYLGFLQSRQAAFLQAASAQVGRTLVAGAALRHAVNAVVLELSDSEAERLAQRDDVRLVEREKTLRLITDRGPAFIGAPSIWDGSATGGLATKGEGIVAAVLDSGINWRSPAFAAVGPIDGYVHVNPLGTGNYLGLCGPTPPNADAGHCNDKLIGLYDFTSTSPERSADDIGGHGSHTASTVAGNAWDVRFGGGTFRLFGVAPHANLIAYKVCDAGCSSVAVTQAADQAVADGIVDILNFSISGGSSPWTESNALAFLGAHDAGIFIAAAAGNNGPAAGTADHQEPWVQTVAASTHDRVLGFRLDATGPGTPPANTQNLPLRPGAQPVQSEDLYNVPLVRSPGFADGRTDGCTASGGYAPGTFTRPGSPPADRVFADGFDPPSTPPPVGAVAAIRVDQTDSACGSGERQANAVGAGAVGVVFVDAATINLGASGNAWSMLLTDWNALGALDPASAAVSITRPVRAYPGTGDVVADFSSRGPRPLVKDQWLLKPDISAPGVDILAAWQAHATATPDANATGLESGTSMSAPHIAGAAALLRALQPTWTPTQIKSAMMLTAKTAGLVRPDGTPADPWDRGAGRVDLVAAAKAGLVLDENGANFLAANPATGGDVAALNLPSLATATCIGPCTYTRTLRRARAGAQTYTATVTGFDGATLAVAPSTFTVGTSGSRTLAVTVQSQNLPPAQWTLGEVVLTPSSPAEPVLHLPVAVKPAGPRIAVSPAALSGSQTLTLRNAGNPTLNWSITTSGTAMLMPLDTATSGSGQRAGYYNAAGTGDYWAQPVDIAATTHVTRLRANGFTVPNTVLNAASAPSVTFSLYADAGGVPAGAPQGFGAAPLWTYANAIGTQNGITATAGNLQLDLAAPAVASHPLDLEPGRYWLMVYPTMNGLGTATAGNPAWAWRVSSDAPSGPKPQLYAPADNPHGWQSDAETGALSAFVQGTVDCTQPSWVGYGSTSGALGYAEEATVAVTFDATGLPVGRHMATLCIASNATNAVTVAIPLSFDVASRPPVLATVFAASIAAHGTRRLTVTLQNPNASPAVLVSDFNVRAVGGCGDETRPMP